MTGPFRRWSSCTQICSICVLKLPKALLLQFNNPSLQSSKFWVTSPLLTQPSLMTCEQSTAFSRMASFGNLCLLFHTKKFGIWSWIFTKMGLWLETSKNRCWTDDHRKMEFHAQVEQALSKCALIASGALHYFETKCICVFQNGQELSIWLSYRSHELSEGSQALGSSSLWYSLVLAGLDMGSSLCRSMGVFKY